MERVSLKVVLKTDYRRKDKTYNIRLRLTINRKVKYYPLNIFVKIKDFSSGGLVKKSDPDFHKKNILISKELNKANKVILDMRILEESVSFDSFEKHYNNDLYGKQSFFDFVDEMIKDNKDKLSPGTIKGWGDEKNKVYNFRSNLWFREINKSFVNNYELHLIKERKNSKNTVTKSLKFLKNMLNRAKEAGMIKENVFDSISLGRTVGNREFLTNEELKILELKYKQKILKPNLNNVLRYFLFSCYTGLRYSDVRSLKFNNIINERYVKIEMHKTKEQVLIPLIPKAASLLPEKGLPEQNVFKVFTDQPTNRYLKDIMKEFKINKSISFHCSRHTFATVSRSLGMEYDVISKILGHTDIKTTKEYVKYELSHLEKEMKKWG